MKKRISLREALDAWAVYHTEIGVPRRHIPIYELYDLLLLPSEAQHKSPLLQHLLTCPFCLDEFKALSRNREETQIWDIAFAKAASSGELLWPKIIPSEDGRYVIEITQSLEQSNKGLIIVRVNDPYKNDMEGKRITVTDKAGRPILKGEVIAGEASQPVDNLDRLSEFSFLIRTE